ncbi:hypothetical protein AAFF_G00063860 [Aldrovandia affinis]|uniref:Uncharacterized protein n=1 Tax=Aldrovandia affinis TaxID=143900 RepID=A0AAD7WYM3_9TELE|nr:hypothetical protein AAFF_G00063860 [Aldrovandia affinis]
MDLRGPMMLGGDLICDRQRDAPPWLKESFRFVPGADEASAVTENAYGGQRASRSWETLGLATIHLPANLRPSVPSSAPRRPFL